MFLTVVLFQYVWVSESYLPCLPKQNLLWESDRCHGSYSQKNQHVYTSNFTYYSQGLWTSDLNQISLALVLIWRVFKKSFGGSVMGSRGRPGRDRQSGRLVSDPSAAVREPRGSERRVSLVLGLLHVVLLWCRAQRLPWPVLTWARCDLALPPNYRCDFGNFSRCYFISL